MAYRNPRFSELGKVPTKVALECSRMVLCSPNGGAHGGTKYWRTPLEKLTLTSNQLPDDAIYVPLGRKKPIRKPELGSMLSIMDGSLTPVSWEDLDPAQVQQIPPPERPTPPSRRVGDYSSGRRVRRVQHCCTQHTLPCTSS